jgi:hypothetical protein
LENGRWSRWCIAWCRDIQAVTSILIRRS